MQNNLAFEFKSRLEKEQGKMAGHYVEVPPDIARALLDENVKRLDGTINGAGFNLALHSDGQGGHRLYVGGQLRSAARLVEGSHALVRLAPDPNPDVVELCEEFAAVLELDEDAGRIFRSLTTGKQRSLAYYANSARHTETRIKRALELANKLKEGTLYVQNRKSK